MMEVLAGNLKFWAEHSMTVESSSTLGMKMRTDSVKLPESEKDSLEEEKKRERRRERSEKEEEEEEEEEQVTQSVSEESNTIEEVFLLLTKSLTKTKYNLHYPFHFTLGKWAKQTHAMIRAPFACCSLVSGCL